MINFNIYKIYVQNSKQDEIIIIPGKNWTLQSLPCCQDK